MHRFIRAGAALLAACLLTALSACSGTSDPSGKTFAAPTTAAKLDPWTVYQQAEKKMSELPSFEISLEQNANLEADGSSIASTATGTIKMASQNGALSKFDIAMSSKSMGATVDTRVYYADGVMYTDMLGMKLRQEVSAEEALSTLQSGGATTYEEKDFANAEVSTKDGNTVLTIRLADDAVLEQMSSSLENMEGTPTVSDAAVTITIGADGYLAETAASLGVEVSGAKITSTITAKYADPNTSVSIEPPADLDSYVASDQLNLSDYLGLLAE